MATPIDFDTLTAAEVDALDGFYREAYYSHVNGDADEAARILALYPDPVVEDDAPVVVEVDAAEAKTSKETQAEKRRARAAAKADARAAADQAAAVAALVSTPDAEAPPVLTDTEH